MNKYPKQYEVSLAKLQPSQLYICKEKLQSVTAWLQTSASYDEVILSVMNINNQLILLDGHTRAYALWCMGITSVLVNEENDLTDWQGYQTCVSWCQEAQIYQIKDLHNRMLSQSDYENLWIKRCNSIFQG